MKISNCDLASISEANQNFSAIARKVDARGRVVLLKNNHPAYIIYSFDECRMALSDDEAFEVAAKRVLKHHIQAFKELAK